MGDFNPKLRAEIESIRRAPAELPMPVRTITLSIDYETYCDLDLKRVGLHNYASHSSCRILMMAWAVNDEAPQLWIPTESPMPERLRKHLLSDRVTKCAWNAQFERVISKHVLGMNIPAEQWRCTMVNSFMLALPGALEHAGRVLRLDSSKQKLAEGKKLIQLFCKPQVPTKNASEKTLLAHKAKFEYVGGVYRATKDTHPTEWATFCAYCKQDVVAERQIKTLIAKYPIPDFMWRLYAVDQKINDAGMPLDVLFIDNAIEIVRRRRAELIDQLKPITGLKNPNSPKQLLAWVQDHGYPFGSLKKERVQKAIDDFELSMTPECTVVLRMRLTIAMSSVKKLATMKRLVGSDGLLRYGFQMAGAGRTNRFAGRGVQLQNMARPAPAHEKFLPEIRQMIVDLDYDGLKLYFGCPIEAVASSVRSAIAAPAGTALVVADLASIETRIAGELADCEAVRRVFRLGLDAYIDFATAMFKKAYAEITKAERQKAKPPVLGGFYMLSGGGEVGVYPDTTKTGLVGYAAAMGVHITPAEGKELIRVFREKYHEVTVMWAEMEKAMLECVETGKRTHAGIISFDMMKPFLRMKLPSGRYIYYLRPKIGRHTIKHAGGEFTKVGISYEGKLKTGGWGRVNTHPGKIFENADQAIAFDILVYGILLSDARGFDIRGHVHDEQITLRDELDDGHTVEELEETMAESVDWLPTLKLAAEGHQSAFYFKG